MNRDFFIHLIDIVELISVPEEAIERYRRLANDSQRDAFIQGYTSCPDIFRRIKEFIDERRRINHELIILKVEKKNEKFYIRILKQLGPEYLHHIVIYSFIGLDGQGGPKIIYFDNLNLHAERLLNELEQNASKNENMNEFFLMEEMEDIYSYWQFLLEKRQYTLTVLNYNNGRVEPIIIKKYDPPIEYMEGGYFDKYIKYKHKYKFIKNI